MHNSNLEDNPIFAVGKSIQKGDMVYTLADDLILKHLGQMCPERLELSQKYENIRNKITQLSIKLCSIFDNITKELLEGKLIIIEEK